MKKTLIFLLILSLFIPLTVKAENNLLENAESGLLMEISTGKIIYEKNIDTEYAVASMTKMMSQIIILENIRDNKLSWDKKVKVSKNAASYGGSQIYLQPGEEMTVRDIFKGISMASANDGTVALAEEIAGTEEEFVKIMNFKASAMGLKNTVFKNSTGLDSEGHYSTSRDMATIARYLLLNYPEVLEYSSIYEDYIREDTPNKFWLVNTNKLIRFYEGADGLKTGHTDNALYCMAVTAKRNNMRLIAITLREPDTKTRNKETSDLLDYGFNNYKLDILKKKEDFTINKKIDKGSSKDINIKLTENITTLLKKNEDNKNYEYEIKIDDIKLPLTKNQVVGNLLLKENNKIIKKYDLITDKSVSKLNLFKLYLDYIKHIITS